MIPGGNQFGPMMGGMQVPGGRHEVPGNSDAVMPEGHLISFQYSRRGYFLCIRQDDDGKIVLEANGGSGMGRDGSQFRVLFPLYDRNLEEKLEEIIRSFQLYRDNGHVVRVDGLADGFGDRLEAKFDSGEQIYKTSNQSRMVSDEAAAAIYDAFLQEVRKEGFDFNTAGSNILLYDDATEDFLQGTWSGTHFGRQVEASFTGSHVIIKVNNEVTDDTDYVISKGEIHPKSIASEGKDNGHDEMFSYCTYMMKKNSFTLVAYVYQNKASSSFEMRKV